VSWEPVIIDLYYEDPDHVHAATSASLNNDPFEHLFQYDGNGNMISGADLSDSTNIASRLINFTSDNLPAEFNHSANGTSNFYYDGEQKRVKKVGPSGTTYYIGEHFEIIDGQATKYIFAGNKRIAKVGSGTYYYHQDHLGSASVISDKNGAKVETSDYLPYGGKRAHAGTHVTSYKYTDQELDSETGLYNYDARLYDPLIGRFISADSTIPNWHDPQALDRYAYVRNNPLAFIDPDGHTYEDALSVWNSFITNPASAKYGLPKAGMFSRNIKYTMPFTDQFKNRLAYMDSKGVDVTKLSHQQLGQQYHQEIIENITSVHPIIGKFEGLIYYTNGNRKIIQ
jgi:RHS repeat-associated protein